tara:strand:- start:101 stop:1078 length:978 start_codon:yes stop_codon:yes gene_type:complete
MNNLAEEQEFETKEETVAEAVETAKAETEQEDDSFEIEVVDDTPEQDKGKPRRSENAEPQVPSDDEVEKYSEGVQKRIKQLKFEYHEERRLKEEASRLQEEALKYAEQIKNENEKLRKTLDEGEGVLVNQAKGRVAAEIDKAKIAYKAAYESGDPDALVDAQEKLSALQAEKLKYESFKPQPRQQQTPPPQSQYQQQTPQPPRPDDRALEWAKNNDWFEKDPEMTGYAYGLHEKLVKSGIDPRSDQYYSEIDDAVRRVFPDKFDDGTTIEESAPQRQTGNVVAPAARSGKKPRKVQLTSTQVSLAKRLGLSNEQYAAQLMKEMKS